MYMLQSRVCVAIVRNTLKVINARRIKGAKVHRANDLSCTSYTINITVGYCLYYYYYLAVAVPLYNTESRVHQKGNPTTIEQAS